MTGRHRRDGKARTRGPTLAAPAHRRDVEPEHTEQPEPEYAGVTDSPDTDAGRDGADYSP